MSVVGISTHANWTGGPVWPGANYQIRNIRYTSKYGSDGGGGPATFTCTVVTNPKDRPWGMEAGRIIRVWRGAENVWTGVINQPDLGGDGIGISAEGIGLGMADRWICTEGSNALAVDIQVDAAISRGLPWTRAQKAPVCAGTMNPGATLQTALDEVAKQTGYTWNVDTTGKLTWVQTTTGTAVQYVLYAYGQGGARTLDNFATDIYAAYAPVEQFMLDSMDTVLTLQTGAAWALDETVKAEGSASNVTLGASIGHRTLSPPANLDGYAWLHPMIAVAGTGQTVSRTLGLTLESGSVPWAFSDCVVSITANSKFVAVGGNWTIGTPPNGFDLTNVTGYSLYTNAGIYLDRLIAGSPIAADPYTGKYSTQLTLDQYNNVARAKYGRYEYCLDLTGQGQISTAAATTAAHVAVDKYGYRTRWTQPFLASQGSLTTLQGQQVDLATVRPGCTIRVMLADLGADEAVSDTSAIDILVGETDYDNEKDVLTLTPVDAQRKDLLTLLGSALPKKRSNT